MVWAHSTHLILCTSVILFSVVFAEDEIQLEASQNDLSIKIDDKSSLNLTLNEPVKQELVIRLTCKDSDTNFNVSEFDCKTIENIPEFYISEGQLSVEITIIGKEPGRETLIALVNNSLVDVKKAFVRVNVGRTGVIDIISSVVGWIYFAAWSISFYPQIWINFKRKSVVGLNFDYVGLNITGFICYSLFNVCLYFSPLIQSQFENKYPRSQIPVEVNDVVFALHAAFATVIIIIQCVIYERGGQRLSLFAKAFLVIAWTASAIIGIIVPATGALTWLTFLYFFSYVKLTITIIKYIPQAWYNYKRKSTVGWSIGNILLDFTGGALSMLQLFLLAYNYDDWIAIFANFTKFGLGMVSILFDVLFMVQHYVLYRDASESENASLANNSIREAEGNLIYGTTAYEE